MTDAIAAVDVTHVVLPLPQPLVLGPVRIEQREYAALRVRMTSGVEGHACCLTRGAPVGALVDRLVRPAAVGADGSQPEEVWERVTRAAVMVGRSGLFMRAAGLLDVALWDAAARRAGVPLWRMLGGARQTADAMLVAVYPTADRPVGDMGEALGRYAAAGWTRLKVARHPDPALMRTLLQVAREAVGDRARLVVDAGFAWRSAAEALHEMRGWGPLDDLAWLEDPLVPEDAAGNAAVRAALPCPVGVGDEATDLRTYRDMLAAGSIDVLRLDVHAVGGITPARDVMALAAGAGMPVSLHVSPETTIHVACGLGGEALVETFDADLPGGNPLDPAHRLWSASPPVRAGRAWAPDEPGLGNHLSSLVGFGDPEASA